VTPADLLSNCDHVLVDFDGPICAVFGGKYSNYEVASQLRELLADAGCRQLPDDVAATDDPFEVLGYAAAHLDDHLAERAESTLRRYEVEAVDSAPPTVGAASTLRHLVASGFVVAIVSNNSVDAINRYVDRHGLRSQIRLVSARTSNNFRHLKPNPFLVDQALQQVGTSARRAVMVGDSDADVDAARAAGLPVIAYANRPEKIAAFNSMGVGVIIKHMTELAISRRQEP
jgi:HAD superfamily hydrolase (TIGR01662 family)